MDELDALMNNLRTPDEMDIWLAKQGVSRLDQLNRRFLLKVHPDKVSEELPLKVGRWICEIVTRGEYVRGDRMLYGDVAFPFCPESRLQREMRLLVLHLLDKQKVAKRHMDQRSFSLNICIKKEDKASARLAYEEAKAAFDRLSAEIDSFPQEVLDALRMEALSWSFGTEICPNVPKPAPPAPKPAPSDAAQDSKIRRSTQAVERAMKERAARIKKAEDKMHFKKHHKTRSEEPVEPSLGEGRCYFDDGRCMCCHQRFERVFAPAPGNGRVKCCFCGDLVGGGNWFSDLPCVCGETHPVQILSMDANKCVKTGKPITIIFGEVVHDPTRL